MPQDGTFVTATPSYMTDAQQGLLRAPAVTHHNERGFSQSFRGVVGTNSTVNLATSWPTDWTPSFSNAGATSELVIETSRNRVGTGTVVSHEERVAPPKQGASRVRTIMDRLSRLNRIQGIIRAPIDQILQMEVLFGEYNGSNVWTGNYASGGRYVITSPGVAASALIKLTCNNPLNPGPFNFIARITITPAAQPQASPGATAPEGPGFLEQLNDTFWEGIRGIEEGRSPFR